MNRRFLLLALLTSATLAQADPAKRPPHQYDLQHVRLEVTLDFKNQAVAGTVDNTLVTTAKDAVLDFDKGKMTILSVTSEGKKLKFKAEDRHLFVPLSHSSKGQKLTVRIAYSAAPEAGLYFVAKNRSFPGNTDLAYSQGEMEDNHNWFPIYDYPDDKATTELIAHVPSGMSVLSNGALASHTDNKKEAVWHWKMDQPMSTYLISLVAGDYVSIPDGTFKGKPVSIWAPRGTEAMANEAFHGTDRLIAIYSKLTGVDYPWPKYAQSMVPEFMFGGMENASCTTQTIGAIFPPGAHGSTSARGLDAHELAHQWFGDLITARNWSHIWVNEGWATFMPHFATREIEGESAFQIERQGTYEGARFGAMGHPMIRADYSDPFEMFDGNAYPGGAARMFMLMHMLGEQKFWKATQAYLTEYGHKNVTTEDFFRSFSKTTGVDLDEFRKQWFYVQGTPHYVVEKKAGTVTITQTNPKFNVKAEVAVLDDKGVAKRLVDTGNTTLKTGGTTVVVDPGAWLLCDVEYKGYSAGDFRRMWDLADNDAQRMRILENQSQDTLKATFLDQSTPNALKQAVFGHLNDVTLLLDYVHSDHDPLALTAVNRAGVVKSDKWPAHLEQILSESDNDLLKNAAYQQLLNIRNDETTANMGLALKTYNLAPAVAALNWFAAHQPEKARRMALDWVRNFAPEPQRFAAISVLGRLKDEPGHGEVFETLMAIAKQRDYAPMQAAFNALADYGDPRAIPVIEKQINHPLSFARNTANGALARLKAK